MVRILVGHRGGDSQTHMTGTNVAWSDGRRVLPINDNVGADPVLDEGVVVRLYISARGLREKRGAYKCVEEEWHVRNANLLFEVSTSADVARAREALDP